MEWYVYPFTLFYRKVFKRLSFWIYVFSDFNYTFPYLCSTPFSLKVKRCLPDKKHSVVVFEARYTSTMNSNCLLVLQVEWSAVKIRSSEYLATQFVDVIWFYILVYVQQYKCSFYSFFGMVCLFLCMFFKSPVYRLLRRQHCVLFCKRFQHCFRPLQVKSCFDLAKLVPCITYGLPG